MKWLRTHYDWAAAFAAVLFLIVSSALIFRNASDFREPFEGRRGLPRSNHKIPEGRAPEIGAAIQELQAPVQWNANSRAGLFVPAKHFIGANGDLLTLETTQLHPPVPNEWLDDFGLPLSDADVLAQDADDDGFTNLDEWQGQTNPTEKGSHPPYIFKLKLRSVSEEPFPLIFSSSVGDTYAINSVDPSQPTQFLQLGETVKGTKYRLRSYVEKFGTDKYGTRVDASELTLEQVQTHDLITLVKENRRIWPESVATFLYTWSGRQQKFTVKKHREFSLQPEEDVTYRLIDVTPEKATIVKTTTPSEPIEIRHL